MFGKTLETVLAERPCRVIIESPEPPARAPRRKRGPAREPASRCVLSALMVLIGVAMIVRRSRAAAAPLAVGVVLGLLFVAAGAGRLYAERRR